MCDLCQWPFASQFAKEVARVVLCVESRVCSGCCVQAPVQNARASSWQQTGAQILRNGRHSLPSGSLQPRGVEWRHSRTLEKGCQPCVSDAHAWPSQSAPPGSASLLGHSGSVDCNLKSVVWMAYEDRGYAFLGEEAGQERLNRGDLLGVNTL